MRAYRLLTGEDGSAFCHKVTQALAKGWVLYGDPTLSYDPKAGQMWCAQAVIKDLDGDYSLDLKLGKL